MLIVLYSWIKFLISWTDNYVIQAKVFEVPEAGVQKIVVATNVAETSITIPDVVCVIDCGRVKEIRCDSMM